MYKPCTAQSRRPAVLQSKVFWIRFEHAVSVAKGDAVLGFPLSSKL